MIYFAAFFLALAGTALCTPFSIWCAHKRDVLDYPKARKVHRQPLPRWGGIGIYFGFFIALIGLYLLFPSFRVLLAYKHKSLELFKELGGIVLGSSMVFVL